MNDNEPMPTQDAYGDNHESGSSVNLTLGLILMVIALLGILFIYLLYALISKI